MASVVLKEQPVRHPDCCLSLSTLLVDVLTSTLTRPTRAVSDKLVLSIGSGSGLLEALLNERWSISAEAGLSIEGVEVQQSSKATLLNKYLPEQYHSSVKGTWDLSPRAAEAFALMFVYPRSPQLVTRYIDEFARSNDASLSVFIWLGPKCDWAEFEHCFTVLDDWVTHIIPDTESGLLGYEILVVTTRK